MSNDAVGTDLSQEETLEMLKAQLSFEARQQVFTYGGIAVSRQHIGFALVAQGGVRVVTDIIVPKNTEVEQKAPGQIVGKVSQIMLPQPEIFTVVGQAAVDFWEWYTGTPVVPELAKILIGDANDGSQDVAQD